MICDVSHSTRYTVPRPAAYDLRRYMRIVGLPAKVRYLCEDCAVGRIAPRFKDELRVPVRS